jgi:hypothetical protein
MDSVRFVCSCCQHHLEAPPDMLGQTINCPACSALITVSETGNGPGHASDWQHAMGYLWAFVVTIAVAWPLLIEPMLLGSQSPQVPGTITIGQYSNRSWQGTIEPASIRLKTLFIFGGCVSILVCVAWSILCNRLQTRRPLFTRIFGAICFLVGSMVPFMCFGKFVQTKAWMEPFAVAGSDSTFTGTWWQRPGVSLLMGIAVSAGFLIAAYFLTFSRTARTPNASTLRKP